MKSRGMMNAVLSGVALIGLMMLSLLVVPADSSTEVYSVPARFSTHTAGQYSSLTQYFRMTCDSVLSVSFFNGWYPGQGTFWAELRDSATGALAWNGSRNTADSLKYKDVGFTVNTVVKRGKTYKLIVGYTYGFGGTDYHLDVYYDSTNAYPYGYMYPYYGSVDLCARVEGTNRIAIDFWGSNWEIAEGVPPNPPGCRDTYALRAESIGAKWNREWFRWDVMMPSSTLDTTKDYWPQHDSSKTLTIQHGARMLGVLFGTPKWCTTGNDTTTSGVWPPPWASHPPKNLFLPVWQNDSINHQNYWGYFVYRTVKHFKSDSVRYWEIWNEENARNYWGAPDTIAGDTTYQNYRSDDSVIALYDRLVRVAACAAHKADPNAKLFLGGITSLMAQPDQGNKGYDWLKKVYQRAGMRDSLNVIGNFHEYFDTTKSFMRTFNTEVDSLRSLMRANGDTAQAWLTEIGWTTLGPDPKWVVNQAGQANRLVEAYTVSLARLGDPKGHVDKVQQYNLKDSNPGDPTVTGSHGLDSVLTHKYAWYAYRQNNAKLKGLNFNRRVPLADTNVYAFEFEEPGAGKKTWVVWRATEGAVAESISIRTNVAYYDSTYYRSSGYYSVNLTSRIGNSGKVEVDADTVPIYVSESLAISRPDVIVDSVWLVKASGTGDPKAGDGVRFYAKIRNIGNAALDSLIPDSVSFYVDGVRKAKYGARRGLGTLGSGTDTLTVGYFGVGPAPDWTANWGDHLIRAWADSADRYVELREDNNCGYLFKHISPKVSVLINNGNKFTNHFSNDTLNLAFNGGTTPQPDSMRVKNEGQWGSWIKPPVTTYVFNFDAGNGNGPRWDSVEIRQSGEADIGGDSIIVDASSPFVDITSPTQGQTVSGNVPFWGWSWDYEDHDSLWEIYVNGSPWVSGNNKVGENPMFGMPGQFGTWDSRTVPNGWRWHQLRSTDAATNLAKDSVKVKVSNHQTNGGDSWASNFGTLPSAPMNVATDPAGNVYFAETQNSKIRKYSPRKDSLFAFSARRSDSTGLNWAVSIVLKDSTTIYIADGYAHAIKAFDRQGNLLLRFGSFGTNAGQFRQPCGIALDHKGRVFVSDRLNNRIQVFDSTGGFLFQFGSQGQDSGKFNSPTGITITPNGLVYVSDTRNNQLQVFDSLGHYLKTIKAVDSLGLDTPLGICSDKYGDIFVADARHNRIVELNPYGERTFDFGGQGDSLWQFRTPVGVASSPGAHYLYVADMGNRRVQKFIVIEEDTTGGGPQGGAGVQVLPLVYDLGPAIPNPSKGQTTFRYALPKESRVNFTIYNVTGQVVKEFNQGKQKAGYYSNQWDGRSNLGHRVGAGVYFYRLTAGSWVKTRKMIVIR